MRTQSATTIALGASAMLIAGFAPPAGAQTKAELEAKVDSLETRVEQLETSDSGRLIIAPNTTLRFYGYAKADFIYDLDFDLGNTIFGIASLGAASVPGENFSAHAFQSRLGLESVTQTDGGPLTVKLEGDFFGSGGGQFRLRHAYGTYRGFLAGQTWTNFMPLESYPGTLDFQGPAGIPFARQTQLRYTHDFANGFALSGSIENDPSALSDRPAITGAASYSFERGFVKLAAVSRGLDGVGGRESAYGINLSGNAQLWSGGSIQASYTTGEGIGSYMVFGGGDLDAVGNAIETEGFTIGVNQGVGEKVTLGLAYGMRNITAGAGALGTDTSDLETVHVNLIYKPLKNLSVGVEYITGERTQFNGASFSADRVQTSVQFNF